MRFPAPNTHIAEVEAHIPTGGKPSLDLMLPVWSPGYYVKLRRIADEDRKFLGGTLPFGKYVFLNSFRRGAGGLEHLNSSLLSSAANPTNPLPDLVWLKYVSHEYFHGQMRHRSSGRI